MDEDLSSWPAKPITSKELKDLEKKAEVKDVDGWIYHELIIYMYLIKINS